MNNIFNLINQYKFLIYIITGVICTVLLLTALVFLLHYISYSIIVGRLFPRKFEHQKLDLMIENHKDFIKFSEKSANQNDTSQKDTLIFCCGNHTTFRQMNEYTNGIFFELSKKYDIYVPKYSNKAISENQLIDSTIKTFEYLKDNGKRNIDVVGFSLGGGISTQAIYKFQQNDTTSNDIFRKVVNYHSFSSIQKAAKAMIGFCPKPLFKLISGIHLDSESVFKKIKCEEKHVIRAKHDKVIKNQGSLFDEEFETLESDNSKRIKDDYGADIVLQDQVSEEFEHCSFGSWSDHTSELKRTLSIS